MMLFMFCFHFCRLGRFAALNHFILWSNGKLGGVHKPAQFCVVIEIRWNLLSDVETKPLLNTNNLGSGRKGRTEKPIKVG